MLYKDKNYQTFAKIADELNVSVKTVRNDISAIKEALAEAGAGEIETKPHVGVRLISADGEIKNLKGQEEENREILFFILRSLFKNNRLTAQELAERYYLTRAQLENILEETADWFSKNRIVFERRKGKGISIEYSELNYREAYFKSLIEYKDFYLAGARERTCESALTNDRDFSAVCASLDGFDAATAARAIVETERDFGFKFDYVSSLRLLFMTSLCIVRVRSKNFVEMPKVSKCPTDGTSDGIIAKRLTEKLERETGTTIPDAEVKFIEYLTATMEIREFESDAARRCIEMMNTSLCRFTIKIINLISEIAGVDLRGDAVLVRQMFLQLKVTVARLKYASLYKNPLLDSIKERYPNMMAVAWLLGNVFEKELKLEINENEAGCLALLTGGAIERHMAQLGACIVCDYGIGISQILREKISRAIPELKITGVFSGRDMRRLKNEPCDFIITTTPLDGYRLNRNVISVGHLLDGGDIAAIEEEMKRLHRIRQKGAAYGIAPNRSIFSRELIFPQCRAKDKDELLKMLCSYLEIGGYVTRGFEKSVFEREASTSTDIGKGFAVPHGLSKYVNRSVAAFASLEEPIYWSKGAEPVDIVFLLAFDLDEDESVRSEIIDFYKSIVNCMDNESKCRRLRSLKDKDELKELLKNWHK